MKDWFHGINNGLHSEEKNIPEYIVVEIIQNEIEKS